MRVAACAAVLALLLLTALLWPNDTNTEDGKNQLVAVPGVLKVYACDLESLDVNEDELIKYELSNDAPFLLALYNPLLGTSNFALPLTFRIPDAYFNSSELTFEITTDYGGFSESDHGSVNYHKQITIANGDKLYFGGKTLLDAIKDVGEEKSFLRILLSTQMERLLVMVSFLSASKVQHAMHMSL